MRQMGENGRANASHFYSLLVGRHALALSNGCGMYTNVNACLKRQHASAVPFFWLHLCTSPTSPSLLPPGFVKPQKNRTPKPKKNRKNIFNSAIRGWDF